MFAGNEDLALTCIGILTAARMLRDVEFFKARMAKIEGSSGLGDFVLTIVGNKPLESAKEASAPTVPAPKADDRAEGATEAKEGS